MSLHPSGGIRDRLDWPLVPLLIVFALVSAAVYRDGPARPVLLTGAALEGRALWNRNNCQACHQLHGFGGFLGPDLTNVASRRTRVEIDSVLATGRGRMPDLELSPSERDHLFYFLQAMDGTGASRPRRAVAPSHLRFAPRPDEPIGARVIRDAGCAACHFPFQVGVAGAPDLTLAHTRVGEAGIRERLARGRGRMPAFAHLPETDVAALVDYLRWLSERRPDLGQEALSVPPAGFTLSEVPWFEYPADGRPAAP